MENILHNYLTKLRIISKIPEHGRLSIANNDLNIYYGGVFGWLFRKAYGDNKDGAAKYLIDLYREINSFSEQLMYNIDTERNEIRMRKKITMLVSLTEKLKESLSGIRNLIGTYKDYLKIISLLECLEQDLIIPQYRTLLKFIPKSYHTKILKTPIAYSHTHTSGIFGSSRNLLEPQNNIGNMANIFRTDSCEESNQSLQSNQFNNIPQLKLSPSINQQNRNKSINNEIPERIISDPINILNISESNDELNENSSLELILQQRKVSGTESLQSLQIYNIPKSEPIDIHTQNYLHSSTNTNINENE